MVRSSCGLFLRCMRLRFAIAAVSFVGFVVFLLVAVFRAPPSTLLRNRPPPSKKVSVLLLLPPHNLSLAIHLITTALSEEHLEAEFLIPAGQGVGSDLGVKGHHVELVKRHTHFSQTVTAAFDHAHFSLMLVWGDGRVSVSEVLPQLIRPVASGHSDLTFAEYSDSSPLLGVLSYPLSGSGGGSNASLFCMHTAVWVKGCEGVSPRAASISLELLAKCFLHHHTSFPLPLPSPHFSHSQMFTQICRLYWQLHPLWCLLAVLSIALVCVLCVRTSLVQTSSISVLHSL